MGDVNSDGVITALDAAEVLEKALAGGFDADYDFSGKKPVKPVIPTESTTNSEVSTEDGNETTTEGGNETTTGADSETTTEAVNETTTETPVETTTEEVVTGEPENAVYDGYDAIVDARIAESNPTRADQPIFKTVREALNAAPSDRKEGNSYVIGIVPGLYREQVIVEKPWITFKKVTNSTSAAEDATLTWYYLESYTYDNVNPETGYWDPDNPKANENGTRGVQQWGQSTHVGADGFRAEGIYFENSSNLYMTQEEKDVNVRPVDTTHPQRKHFEVGNGTTADTDVRSSQWIERGAAIYIQADKVVLENCKVIGTQDSVGTCEEGKRIYFKNCYLAGQVDFICGGSQCLFDNCEIHWQSSPYEDSGSALTAAKNEKLPKGYLFYNCKITGGDRTNSKCTFARPWGGENTDTVWVNTVISNSKVTKQPMVRVEGWGGMGNTSPKDVRSFFEYGSKDENGNLIDTSKRTGTSNHLTKNGVLGDFEIVKYNPYRYTSFIGDVYDGWDPAGVADKWREIEAKQDEVAQLEESYTENFKLPDAPAGYEIKYYVDSNFVKLSADGKTAEVTRPIYNDPDAEVEFTVYLKKVGTIDGVEFTRSTKIKAIETSADNFKTKGTVKVDFPLEKDLKINLSFDMADGHHVTDKEVIISAGNTSVGYVVESEDGDAILPAEEYNVTITYDNPLISVKGGEVKKVIGEVGTDYTLDIGLGVLETVNGNAGDLNGSASTGYTMKKFSDSEKGEVYHFKKEASANLDAKQKFVWDLAALAKDDIVNFKTADQVRVNFSVKVPSSDGWSDKLQNYFDITGADAKDYAASPDNTRYLRFRLGNNWQQFDVHSSTVDTFHDSSTNDVQKLNLFGKFKAGENAGKWADVSVTLNYKNGEIVIDSKGSSSSTHAFTGANGIPSGIDRGKLNFVIYPQDASGLANNEYYISKPTISYERFIAPKPTTGVDVSGTSENVTKLTLVNKNQPLYRYDATIGNDGAITFAEKIPAGEYSFEYTLSPGASTPTITGTGAANNTLTVGTADITDLSVVADKIVDFVTAETAINKYFEDNFTKNSDGAYVLDTSIKVPTAEGYTITIKEATNNVTADGGIVRDNAGSTPAVNKLNFTITINGEGGSSEDYSVDVLVEPKTANMFERDFEELPEGTEIPAANDFVGKIVRIDGRKGNVIEFSNFKKDGTQADGASLEIGTFGDMDKNGIYAVSFDVMKDNVTNRGWRLQLNNYLDLLYNQGNINFDVYGGVGNCGGYSASDVYGASKNTLTEGKANQWYNITVVSNNKNSHADVYLDGKYVTSYKGAPNTTPSNLKFGSFYGDEAGAISKVYVDNIKVDRLDTDFENEFNAAMTGKTIPTNVGATDIEVDLPLTTANGNVISWSKDKDDTVIEIGKDGKAVFKAQQGETTAKLTAVVTNAAAAKYPGCQNPGVINTISYSKTYGITFEKNATESFSVKGNVTFEIAPTKDVDVKIEVLKGTDVQGRAIVTMPAGQTTKEYTISDIVPGEYDIQASVTTEGVDSKVRKVADAESNEITKITGTKDDVVVNVTVGEWGIKYAIDFDTKEVLPQKLTKNSDTGESLTVAVETDNGNKYLKMTATGAGGANVGVGYDLFNAINIPSNDLEKIKNADEVTVSYKVKRISATQDSYFDLTSGSGENGFAPQVGDTYGYEGRFCYLQTHNSWSQFNLVSKNFNETIAQMGVGNNGVSNGLKFENNTNAWYDINLNIDYKNNTVLGTIGVGDNIATLVLDGGSLNGTNGLYPGIDSSKFPTTISRDKLNLAFYPRNSNCEYWLDDIQISYDDWKAAE